MIYMLDTNVCIYLIKRKPLSYFRKLDTLAKDNTVAISSIVLSELQYGVSNSIYPEQNQINVNLLLNKLVVMSYTDECALFYGQVRSQLQREGKLIGANDLLIAAHALCVDATLVTNNTSEFQRISKLKIENWDED